MVVELVPGSLRFTLRKKVCQSDNGVGGLPKRNISRPTLSTDTVQRDLLWERQKRCSSRKRQEPMVKKRCYSEQLMTFFGGREDEDKKRQKKSSKLIFFLSLQNYHFWTYIENMGTFTFWCMVTPSFRSTLGFTHDERPKGFVNWLSFQETGPWEKAILPWSNFMSPWCIRERESECYKVAQNRANSSTVDTNEKEILFLPKEHMMRRPGGCRDRLSGSLWEVQTFYE